MLRAHVSMRGRLWVSSRGAARHGHGPEVRGLRPGHALDAARVGDAARSAGRARRVGAAQRVRERLRRARRRHRAHITADRERACVVKVWHKRSRRERRRHAVREDGARDAPSTVVVDDHRAPNHVRRHAARVHGVRARSRAPRRRVRDRCPRIGRDGAGIEVSTRIGRAAHADVDVQPARIGDAARSAGRARRVDAAQLVCERLRRARRRHRAHRASHRQIASVRVVLDEARRRQRRACRRQERHQREEHRVAHRSISRGRPRQ